MSLEELKKQMTDFSNVNKFVLDRFDRNLYMLKNHPLEIIKRKIYEYFLSYDNTFKIHENLNKIVSTEDNFDKLLIPITHPARSKSDTYYVNENHVLRTHTTAHQTQLLQQGEDKFIICGDVYRKDEIDMSHYPIFCQVEGVILYNKDDQIDLSEKLINILKGLTEHLFKGCESRVNPDYFPFTHPSYEMEVLYDGKWLEVLGCGIIQEKILENCNVKNKKGIAWGIGLERLAMILFKIPDIRYFWMTDNKFLDQFSSGALDVKFTPFSPLPPIYRDLSIYINNSSEILTENEKFKWTKEMDFLDEIRLCSDDSIKSIEMIDQFYNKKLDKYSICYRMHYSPNNYKIINPTDFKDEVDGLQNKIREHLKKLLWLEVR